MNLKNYRYISNSFLSLAHKTEGIFLLILLVLECVSVKAQQIPRYSQYIMNEFIINPSVAGADGRTTYNLTARKEWLGFSQDFNTPETYSFSAQTRILKRPFQIIRKNSVNRYKERKMGRVGIGGSIFTDRNAAVRRTGIQTTYAYHITGERAQYSFGLTASVIQLKFNTDDLDFYDNDNEVMLNLAGHSAWIPDFGAGFNFLTRNFHCGISVSQILQSPLILGNPDIDFNSSNIGTKRHYFFIAALHKEFRKNSNWGYEPSVFIKMYDLLRFKGGYKGPGTQADFSYKLFYMNKYWFGLSYRTTSDLVVMGGMKISNLYISYSFDYGTGELARNSFGSHEISIASKFGDSTRRYRWMERY